MNFLNNKRGQGMSTNTIVLLILGLIVLVALIWGFATGWSSFQGVMNPTNVGDIVEECNSVCGINEEFTYCNADKELRFIEEDFEIKTSCYVLASLPELDRYGIEDCPAITCKLTCDNIRIDEETGISGASDGKYDVSSLVTDGDCFIN